MGIVLVKEFHQQYLCFCRNSWIILFFTAVGVLVVFYPLGNPQSQPAPVEPLGVRNLQSTEQTQFFSTARSLAVDVWECRLRIMCCCLPQDESNRAVFSNIAKLLNRFFSVRGFCQYSSVSVRLMELQIGTNTVPPDLLWSGHRFGPQWHRSWFGSAAAGTGQEGTEQRPRLCRLSQSILSHGDQATLNPIFGLFDVTFTFKHTFIRCCYVCFCRAMIWSWSWRSLLTGCSLLLQHMAGHSTFSPTLLLDHANLVETGMIVQLWLNPHFFSFEKKNNVFESASINNYQSNIHGVGSL